MERVETRVASSLTRFYVVALFIVAILTLGGLFLIRKTIMSLNYDSRVVNVAGRQRMLSQRLTKLAVLKIQNIKHQDPANFDSLLHTWKNSHHQLSSRKLLVGNDVVTWKSKVLDGMFQKVDPVFEEIYQNLLRINTPGLSAEDQNKALAVILENEPVFLGLMNDIVFQYDKESVARLQNLERIEWIMDIMTILVLIAEGILVFRPVVNTTRRAVRLLSESEENLRRANLELENTNQQLIKSQAELLRFEEEKYKMQRAEDQIRAAALIEGQEQERKRFALELHDGIGQMLTGLKLHAESLTTSQLTDEKYRLRIDKLIKLIQDTIQTTRQISYNLMPSVLWDFGLNAALKLLCQQTAESTRMNILFDGVDERIPLSSLMEVGLYRIAQEAVNNAVKYANAGVINVSLKTNQKNKGLVLEIKDDGKGFEIEKIKEKTGPVLSRNGIENIRTRTRLFNGQIEILSNPGAGTTIRVEVKI